MKKDFLLGNSAIALGLLEAGCEVFTAYPGTPSSEILPEFIKMMKKEKINNYVEWSINEKVAFDNAFAASITGKRAACCMKQVGLNVASDSLMSSAYLGTKGGFIIISCDDPGPHSSQTEQDSRIMAKLAKLPVFDPSSPSEAREMIKYGYEISEEFEIPVVIRPTTRICHSKEIIVWNSIKSKKTKSIFIKNPTRWASTPKYRFIQHKILNDKLNKIEKKINTFSIFNKEINFLNEKFPFGIISSGFSFTIVLEFLKKIGREDIPLLKIGSPFPFPRLLFKNFLNKCEKVLVIEETDILIELFLGINKNVLGRCSKHVPSEGELTPEKIAIIIKKVLLELGLKKIKEKNIIDKEFFSKIKDLNIPERRPTLCPGCPHRASFFAIAKALPRAIYTSDIGCYTLGMNMGCVDTCVDMGASITMASGFYQSFRKDGVFKIIVATIGDSTFIHSGITGLVNAVNNNAKFILVILDNGTIAMTGMQPSPTTGILADGKKGNIISLEKIIRGCGVDLIDVVDPYKIDKMVDLLKDASKKIINNKVGIYAIIAKSPCLVAYKKDKNLKKIKYYVSNRCDGCDFCHIKLQCPALIKNIENNSTLINQNLCNRCGVCYNVCVKKAIYEKVK